jgi:hypothetical protein
MYALTLTVGKDVFKGTGKDALEAITTLQLPTKVPGKALLTFEKDGKTKDVYVTPVQIKRIPMKINRIFMVKQFEYGLK